MAFLSWILFDEQFKLVASSSGSEQVGDDNEFREHLQNLVMSKSGYLFVYVSNASTSQPVYWDNLQLSHEHGPILEETHYYPFGLTMAGISSKTPNSIESKKRFQGQEFAHGEFSDGSGLETYEFKYRMDDCQTGRFWQVDPLAEKYVYNSTYAFSENKVTAHVELEGLEAIGATTSDLWRSAGITSTTSEKVVREVKAGIQMAGTVSKDLLTIGVGVTVVIASGGTATPLVGLLASATVTGGSMKLAFDLSGNPELADQVPTTLTGAVISSVNDAAGKEVFSKDVKVVAEMTEGILTFDVKGLNKMPDLKKVSAGLSGISLTLDGLNPDLVKALKNIYEKQPSWVKTIPQSGDIKHTDVDNTYVKKADEVKNNL